MYVAGKRLRVGDGWANPGDPLPDAKDWPNIGQCLRTGKVISVASPEDANVFEALVENHQEIATLKARIAELEAHAGPTARIIERCASLMKPKEK